MPGSAPPEASGPTAPQQAAPTAVADRAAAQRRASRAAASRRAVVLALFATLWLWYGWFHQGGGWNQNARFAQVRALAHDATFAIDDHLLYTLAEDDAGRLRYTPLPLSQPDTRSTRLPRAASLDLSEHAGHVYPNKPPGLSLLALPGYGLWQGLAGNGPGGEAAHDDAPDATPVASGAGESAWHLALALYWTTWLSVGLLSALGGVAFFDVATRLFPDTSRRSRLLATLTYALGTPVFAYATFLIDHAVVASLSLFALRSVLVARERIATGGASARTARPLFAAGSLAGLAVLVNNSAAFTALGLGAFALAVLKPRTRALAYVAGGVLPALALAYYQASCFGSPFALPQHHQLGMFQSQAPVLGVFGAVRLDLLPKLLVMPYRGLFFWSPVLAAGLVAWLVSLRHRERRPTALLALGLFAAFLLMNTSFNAWHGGGTFGPRYLVPAVPFLALPLCLAFQRTRVATTILAAVSFASALLVTAVSPQLDAALHRPLSEFYLPLLRGETLGHGGFVLHGPVSVHPTGFPGGGIEVQAADTDLARWNSFNLGELLFPGSLWSLAPLALLTTAIFVWLRGRLAKP